MKKLLLLICLCLLAPGLVSAERRAYQKDTFRGGRGSLSLTPGELGATAWWDASLSAITKDGSNLVSQWNDLSGNNYHLTQGTGGNKPTYMPNGLNGRPVLEFDGVNDVMSTTLGAALSQPWSLFAVVRSDVTSYEYETGIITEDAVEGHGLIVRGSTDTYSQFGSDMLDSILVDLSPHMLIAIGNGASSSTIADGVATAGPSGWDLGTSIFINSSVAETAFNGRIAAAGIVSRALSVDEIQRLSMYYRRRYATP